MLELKDIWKSYEGAPLLRGVSFQAAPGEIVCLLGASGSGKSTLLRVIAGLEQAEKGQVLWQGKDIVSVSPHLRGFGLMFQDYALFPHRDVFDNVAFGLRMQGLPRSEIDQSVKKELERVNLLSFARRRVTDLSGGEQQRVALARALAPKPNLLMLDEPLGALDRTLREQLIRDLRRILHDAGIPVIYVTHDQEEAFALADRIMLLHDGVIIQSGAPEEVYQSPVSEWVARFLGLNNLLSGEVVQLNPLRVHTHLGIFESTCSHNRHFVGQTVMLLMRPSGAQTEVEASSQNYLQGVVEDSVFRGNGYSVTISTEFNERFDFLLDHSYLPGTSLILRLGTNSIQCLG